MAMTTLATPGAALAFDGATPAGGRIQVNGYVSLICRASLDQSIAPAGADRVDLGGLSELCNSAKGFDVFVDTPLGAEGLALEVDGVQIPLAPGASTVVDSAAAPTSRVRQVALVNEGRAAPVAIAFRVVPR